MLEALILSYQSRDSTEYDSLYASSYIGTSTNLNAPPGNQTSTFHLADEAAHIAALAKSTTISSIVLDLGPSSTWTRLPSDDVTHPEWAMIQIGAGNFHGEISDGGTSWSIQSINPMIFAFTPTVAAPGDTTWKIIRWTEVGQGV
ncbi:MAG TPA: hypothetical protein VFR25_02695 [Candidatus Eisenbacteria bacterium]|nr:hypothetical protein [Candidatus Eisenbacteria bacterium]